jgi:GAF domain-containing protein
MLEQSRVPLSDRRKDIAEGLDDTLQLHEIGPLLIQDGDPGSLNRILDAAMDLMSSDMASVQLFVPERKQLQLLAWKGFHPQSATFWQTVHFNSACTCGIAFSTGCRVVVPDVETCDFMAGTADLDEYHRSNIRAVQSTPLFSRSGQPLGMISTHWREPHQPERGVRSK